MTVLAPTIGPSLELGAVLHNAVVPTDNGAVSVHELWGRYDTSDYGLHMDQQPLRFTHTFGYEEAQMKRDLGMDVVPRTHQYETALYVAALLKGERDAGTVYDVSDDEHAIALFATSVHDMGETTSPVVAAVVGTTVGDIEHGKKTPENRKVEADVRQFLYETLYADVHPGVLQKAEAIIAHDDDSFSHDVFEAAHNLQAYMTAVRARIAYERGITSLLTGSDSNADTFSTDSLSALNRLHTSVVEVLGGHVMKSADRYSYAGNLLVEARVALQTSSNNFLAAHHSYRRSQPLLVK